MDQALVAELEKSNYQIEVHSEVVDAILYPDEASQRKLGESYLFKYRDLKPDVILAVGITPLKFLVQSSKWFFPDVPVVFCGSTEEMLGDQKLNSRFTGVWGQVQPAKTLEAALKLFPDTKHVVVVGGTGEYDRYLEAIARKKFRLYEWMLNFTYLTDLDMPTLLERLKHLPPNTIIYHTSIMRDAKGTRFIDATQSVPLVVAAANAPIFTADNVDIGRGTVGGDVLDFADQGRIAAGMAMRVLNGEKPQNIPVVKSSDVYTFDWRALQRWRLSESNLPPGSVVLYRQLNAWDLYKWYIIGGVLLFFLEALLVLGLLWERGGRKRIAKSLRMRLAFETLCSEISENFLNLPEESFSSSFQDALRGIVNFLQISEAAVYEENEESKWRRGSVWNNNGASLLPEVLDDSQFPWFTSRVMGGEIVFIPDPNALPAEASAEKEYLLKKGVMSAAGIPLIAGGKAFGCLGLLSTNRRMVWTDEKEVRLKRLSELLSVTVSHRQINAALRESEQRFRLMANTAPVLIWMSGTDGLCTYFNKSWLGFTGRKLEKEIGNGWTEGVHPEDMSRCMDTYLRAFNRREMFGMEYRLRRHDGEYRWVLDVGVPRFNHDGSFSGFIGSAIDITHHKEAREALAGVSRRLIEAQEEERRHIARELHDNLSQDLALLAVEIQNLEDSVSKPSQRLRGQTERLRKHISDISEEIHLLSHRLHPSKLELLGVVVAVNSFCNELAEQHDVEIRFDTNDVPGQLPKDLSLCLFRILQEALTNAVKYSGVKQFEVELQGLPGEIMLTIQDFGVGFDVEGALTKGGLGLISMQERVNLVSGSISINSEPMQGTHIIVRIPLASEALQGRLDPRRESEHVGGKVSGHDFG